MIKDCYIGMKVYNLLALGMLPLFVLACSRSGECLSKGYINGMYISPVNSVTEFSSLRILAAKKATGVASFPVMVNFVKGGKTGELIYDICDSNALFRMSSFAKYNFGKVTEVSTITGDVSIVESPGFDFTDVIVSLKKSSDFHSLRICELDVVDKIKFGDKVEVLWPRTIDSYRLSETRTGYFDDDVKKEIFSFASYSAPEDQFIFLYAVYDAGGGVLGWGMAEVFVRSDKKLDVILRRYGQIDKYDARIHESACKPLLMLSIGNTHRTFVSQVL